jgi:hypothetical protein
MTSRVHVYELLVAGYDDWVSFPHACAIMGLYGPSVNHENERQVVLRGIRTVADAGLVEIGDTERKRGFIPWPLSTDQAIRRIEQEWRALKHFPYSGDVCWLQSTERGYHLGADLMAQYGE